MKDTLKKCPFCNGLIQPGDQKCIHCGKKLPNVNLNINDLMTTSKIQSENKKEIFSFGLKVTIGVIVFCLLIVGILFFFLGGQK